MPLAPRSVSPRIDAAKAAIIACPNDEARSRVRRWVRDNVDANGAVSGTPGAERSWPSATLGLIVALNASDLSFVRAWLLRWVGDAGELLIPNQAHSTYQYPTAREPQ
jgi:hypothetical protein